MTINKAQGQTFSNVLIDLQKDVFSHGQLYVAILRVRSWNGLKKHDNKLRLVIMSLDDKDDDHKNL